jgi:hypothetical protein
MNKRKEWRKASLKYYHSSIQLQGFSKTRTKNSTDRRPGLELVPSKYSSDALSLSLSVPLYVFVLFIYGYLTTLSVAQSMSMKSRIVV